MTNKKSRREYRQSGEKSEYITKVCDFIRAIREEVRKTNGIYINNIKKKLYLQKRRKEDELGEPSERAKRSSMTYHPCHRLCIVFASSVAVVSVAPAKPVSLSPAPASSGVLVAVGTAASPVYTATTNIDKFEDWLKINFSTGKKRKLILTESNETDTECSRLQINDMCQTILEENVYWLSNEHRKTRTSR